MGHIAATHQTADGTGDGGGRTHPSSASLRPSSTASASSSSRDLPARCDLGDSHLARPRHHPGSSQSSLVVVLILTHRSLYSCHSRLADMLPASPAGLRGSDVAFPSLHTDVSYGPARSNPPGSIPSRGRGREALRDSERAGALSPSQLVLGILSGSISSMGCARHVMVCPGCQGPPSTTDHDQFASRRGSGHGDRSHRLPLCDCAVLWMRMICWPGNCPGPAAVPPPSWIPSVASRPAIEGASGWPWGRMPRIKHSDGASFSSHLGVKAMATATASSRLCCIAQLP